MSAREAVPERLTRDISRLRPEDAAEVMDFLVREFGPESRQADPRRITWLYEQNPSLDEAGPGIWICRKQGRIVGYESEIPFELQVGGGRRRPGWQRRAAWAIDLEVQREWRLAGIGPGLIASQLAGRSIVGVLNLSEQGYAAYSRLGWTDLGVVPVYVRPLDAGVVLRAPRSPVPARLRRLAPVAGPVLRAVDAGLQASLRSFGVRLVEVDRLDERVDDVWATAAPHYPVLARRDLASLAWRIDARPDSQALTRCYLLRRTRPLGYAVLRPTLSSPASSSSPGSDDPPAMVVVDYLAPPAWVAPLLLLAGSHARRRGAAALVVRTRNQPADRYLRAAGFVRRDSINDPPIRFMVNCADEADVCRLVNDPDAWFITSTDADLDHAAMVPPEPNPGEPGRPWRR